MLDFFRSHECNWKCGWTHKRNAEHYGRISWDLSRISKRKWKSRGMQLCTRREYFCVYLINLWCISSCVPTSSSTSDLHLSITTSYVGAMMLFRCPISQVSDVDIDKLLHHKKVIWLNSPETMKANSLRWSPAPLRKTKSELTMRCFGRCSSIHGWSLPC